MDAQQNLNELLMTEMSRLRGLGCLNERFIKRVGKKGPTLNLKGIYLRQQIGDFAEKGEVAMARLRERMNNEDESFSRLEKASITVKNIADRIGARYLYASARSFQELSAENDASREPLKLSMMFIETNFQTAKNLFKGDLWKLAGMARDAAVGEGL